MARGTARQQFGVYGLKTGLCQLTRPVPPRHRLTRADRNPEQPLGRFVKLSARRRVNGLGPDGLDEREISPGAEHSSGMRKDFREIHLEKHALCNDRVIRRSRPVVEKLLAARRHTEAASKPGKQDRIGLDCRDIPPKGDHARGRITDAGAYFQNTSDVQFGEPPQNPLRSQRSAGMKIAHSQPGAILMILEQVMYSVMGAVPSTVPPLQCRDLASLRSANDPAVADLED